MCSAGVCVGGAATNCDDGNVCTDDSCDAGVGCLNLSNVVPCDDANACTTNDTCAGGTCLGGPALDCDDGNVCTADTCDTQLACQHSNVGLPCDDGDACTIGDTCSAGACISGTTAVCDDGNPCTDDTCDAAGGCITTPNSLACDDGNACTSDDICVAGQCVSGSAVVCDDGNVCTDETCNPAVGCISQDNTATCSDQDALTQGDVCLAGACISGHLGCPPQPVAGCRAPSVTGKSSLVLKNRAKDSKDRVVWKWKLGSQTTTADYGNPTDTATTDYMLCVYDSVSTSPNLLLDAVVQGGLGGWRTSRSGFIYSNRSPVDGIVKMSLVAGNDGKARALAKGKGATLGAPDLPLALDGGVTVQLLSDQNCWTTSFTDAKTNTGTSFKAFSSN